MISYRGDHAGVVQLADLSTPRGEPLTPEETEVQPTAQEQKLIDVATRIHHSDEQSVPNTEGFTHVEILATIKKFYPNSLLERSLVYRCQGM